MKIMAEMTPRQRIITTLNKKKADRLPFCMERTYLPQGQMERRLRNLGLGITYNCPCFMAKSPDVNMTRSAVLNQGRSVKQYTYKTPVGTVTQIARDAKPFLGKYDGIVGWYTKHVIEKPEDWDILKFIVENTQYTPYYERFEYFKDVLGDDGIVNTSVGFHSAYTNLLIDWVGASRLYIDHVKYPQKVDEVLEAIAKNQEKQYPIAVEAPADYFMMGDHIDDAFISPKAFEKYVLPPHKKFAQMAHAKGKITAIHCDGRLKGLKDLIAELEHDVIHAITPPPIGNLPIKEALNLWEDKVLWINFEYYSMGVEAMKKRLIELLHSIIPGYRVIIDPSTERWVPPEYLHVFTKIISQTTLPLTKEKIDKIERSL